MSSPTTRASNIWPVEGGDDILQISGQGGAVLGGITAGGSGFGALAGGGIPAGSTGDIQFNNNGAFGNADSVFAGSIFSIDPDVGNLTITLPSGSILFSGFSADFHVVGNASFESDQGDISCTASTGRFNASGLGASFVANSGEGINFDTTSSPDPAPIIFQSSGAIQFLPGTTISISNLQVFADNAAAISGGLAANDLYRTGADPDVVCIVH